MIYTPSPPYDPTEGCLPCPFCGVPAHIHTTGNGRESGQMWGIEHYEGIPDHNCPIAYYGFYHRKYPTREAAVTAWNNRKSVTLPECVFPIGWEPILKGEIE